ncbi:hypothetical protein [Streptomyces griseocarneus]|uniref:hypothetical protein n=1 Tax=Streptomyces griseocarneus TaxID=51201 RepID=UPI00167C76E0|nr:hypothetical protein [Streptomyces griseocarneus]MBZ6472149.1 hypothetical protein [Streptomyces griseocarneus]GHG73589.1 hypothetical protein GCM10018779_49880 [Streptomyces griseocarneus]
MSDGWDWEYWWPETELGLGPELAGQVKERCEELLRAAETLYISGERHEGGSEAQTAYVASGMFEYLVAPRLLKLVVVSVTAY